MTIRYLLTDLQSRVEFLQISFFFSSRERVPFINCWWDSFRRDAGGPHERHVFFGSGIQMSDRSWASPTAEVERWGRTVDSGYPSTLLPSVIPFLIRALMPLKRLTDGSDSDAEWGYM